MVNQKSCTIYKTRKKQQACPLSCNSYIFIKTTSFCYTIKILTLKRFSDEEFSILVFSLHAAFGGARAPPNVQAPTNEPLGRGKGLTRPHRSHRSWRWSWQYGKEKELLIVPAPKVPRTRYILRRWKCDAWDGIGFQAIDEVTKNLQEVTNSTSVDSLAPTSGDFFVCRLIGALVYSEKCFIWKSYI